RSAIRTSSSTRATAAPVPSPRAPRPRRRPCLRQRCASRTRKLGDVKRGEPDRKQRSARLADVMKEIMGNVDPIASVVLLLAVILLGAKLGGDLATRLGQPAVLGELVAGVVLGNLHLLGISALEPIKSDPAIDMLSRIGVIILLFEVGLESTVAQMMKVGL